ncbi:hypothetical protein AFLA_012989 [Aspergillus flavus NRRL3357]|nr:hypothetical protein AFLA_012989 [Aspergillus flavus NRRL3357]
MIYGGEWFLLIGYTGPRQSNPLVKLTSTVHFLAQNTYTSMRVLLKPLQGLFGFLLNIFLLLFSLGTAHF